jgi:hypothetical protein
LHYAFIDESGTADPFSGSHFLVIALLSTTRPRPIELHVRRAHKKYGTSLASREMELDKRYTTKRLRYRLEKEIREEIADLHQEVVIIRQEDSIAHKELQAVDYIAWAFFQKYERRDDRFYQIIANRVIVEEVIRRGLWRCPELVEG